MDAKPLGKAEPLWSRRRLLEAGLLGSAGLALGNLLPAAHGEPAHHQGSGSHGPGWDTARSLPFDPQSSLRDFDWGELIEENGSPIRCFNVEARSITLPLAPGIRFKAWTLDGRVPGPTLRARQGERVRVVFHNADSTSHSLHFHGEHPAASDGIAPVLQGRQAIYDFDLPQAGLFPYHCHVAPISRHIGKGLFGLLVVDPPQPRASADELVLVMGGYDLDNDGRNELYAFNGIPDAYMHQPIRIRQNALIRLYVLNMTELDAPLSFHTHGNSFKLIAGPGAPGELIDVITLGMAERCILELRYRFPGRFMFHPHQDPIAERGCMGFFDVTS